MRRAVRFGSLLAAVLAFAAGAVLVAPRGTDARAAGGIFPAEGTSGERLVLTGHGFTPTARPRVDFVPASSKSKVRAIRAKVLSYSADEIAVALPKGAPGAYAVRVTPAGKHQTAVEIEGLFTLGPPVPVLLDPAAGRALAVVTIHGIFGDTRGTVRFGKKKAKVTAWANESITAVVPKSAPVGVQQVSVTNRTGTSAGTLAYDVTGGPPPSGPSSFYVRGDVGGVGHFAMGHDDFTATYSESQSSLTIVGTTLPRKPAVTVVFTIGVPEFTRPVPYDLEVNVALPHPTFVNGQVTLASAPLPFLANLTRAGSSFHVEVTESDGTYIAGTYDGTLVYLGGGATDPVTMSGEFRAKIRRTK